MHNQAQIITHLLKDTSLMAEVIYSMKGDGQADQNISCFFLTEVELSKSDYAGETLF